jgi:hypothetical protein
MKNLTKYLKNNNNLNIKRILSTQARSREEWESIKSYPFDMVDEHEEPEDEEIVREIFDRNYYQFMNKGRFADAHGDVDQFGKARMWQHLYITPK